MGNGNCCYHRANKNNKDLDVESIFKPIIKTNSIKEISANLNNLNQENSSNNNIKLLNTYYITNQEKIISPKFENFDYDSNSQRLSIEEKKKEKDSVIDISIGLLKLARNQTFGNIQSQKFFNFSSNLIKEINTARINPLEFSEKFKFFNENFNLIEKKINEINDEKTRKFITRKKEDFKEASDFFRKLHEENLKEQKEKLNEIILIDDLKLPMPKNLVKLLDHEYQNNFCTNFMKNSPKKLKIRKIVCNLSHSDSDITFFMLFSHHLKKWNFLFEEKLKYVGINHEEFREKVLIISLVFASEF